MTENKKSMIKNMIYGLVAGGSLASVYALHKALEDKKSSESDTSNEIVVPLSRKNFLKVLKNRKESVQTAPEKSVQEKDIANLTPNELTILKKNLLRKNAQQELVDKTGPVSSTTTVRKTANSNYAPLRNMKGQFSNESNLSKLAGVAGDAGGTIMDIAGAFGGFMLGSKAIKMISDRIMVNRKKEQLEQSRQRYADMLSNEVNDDDMPYYRKQAGDRGTIGSALGLAGAAGIATTLATSLVVYRIMENRRKEQEKELDKDLAKYPPEKTIKYKFASDKNSGSRADFFA